MDRVKTGIPGFDDLVEGGLPRNFNVLVTGAPGTGKTIFGIQYLYNGAKNGENGVYISLDSPRERIIAQSKVLGMDLESLEKEKKILLLEIPTDMVVVNIFEMINSAVQSVGAKRLVFDNLINFAININQFVIPVKYKIENSAAQGNGDPSKSSYQGDNSKRITYLLINELSKFGTTNIIITASAENDEKMTADGVSEYACDGVTRLHAVEGEENFNTLNITKMRLTNVNRGLYNFRIGQGGISLVTDG